MSNENEGNSFFKLSSLAKQKARQKEEKEMGHGVLDT